MRTDAPPTDRRRNLDEHGSVVPPNARLMLTQARGWPTGGAMMRRALTLVMVALAAVLTACVLLIHGVGRNSFVGEASVSFRGVTYPIAPEIFCGGTLAATFILALIAHRIVHRR